MMIKNPKITFTLITFITGAIVLTSCGQKSQSPDIQQQQYQISQEADKAPDQLKSIENNVEQIIKAFNGPAVLEEKPQSGMGQDSGQSGRSEKESSKKDEKSESDQGSEGKDQATANQEGKKDQEAQESQPPAPQAPWEAAAPMINSLHYQWNAYFPMAIKKGASKQLVDNFSNALNSLTSTILSKNATNTLMAASSLYACIPDFYSLYKTEASPEIKRIRHYIRSSMLNATTGNWAQTETDVNNLKSSWSLYKNTIQKDQQDNATKLDFSIYELEKVIREKNQPLIDIKGRIALSNVQAMDKPSGK